jgi:hypothetical protein
VPTTLISAGPAFTMLQNVVYALPASRCLLFCQTAAPVLEMSNELAFTTVVTPLTLTNGQCEVAGAFIRSTAVGGAIITLKKF